MKSQRRNARQFDLPVIGSEFNLRTERGTDFDRIVSERQQAEADRAAAEKCQLGLAETFGEPIASYSRRQAIEDGVLVDLMQPETVGLVREAGFKFPIAMTAGAFAATVAEIGQPLPEGQDIQGRLWDVLWMLKCAIRASTSTDRIHFQVCVWDGQKKQVVRLWSQCGPGERREPVITIMLEGED